MPGVRQKTGSTPTSAPKQIKQGRPEAQAILHRRAPTPTPVFDAYWEFAAERQRIFRDRLVGRDWSTDDVVLQRFRFTNAYRASDRVSQFLIQHVIYGQQGDWRDVFFRVVLFKLFNKIETWIELEAELDTISRLTFDVETYAAVLERIRERRGTLYSAAYIMPSAQHFGSKRKHVNHLRLIRHMLETHLPERLLDCGSASKAFVEISGYPSMGPFLAYQLLTDLCYSSELSFSESEFVCAGPGALDGLHKCFSDPGDYTPNELIAWTMERQRDEFERRGIEFQDLWGRALQLIDCQNLFCEISKYAREAFPHVQGKSERTRIKQGFCPRPEPLSAWYPPKWGLNDHVRSWLLHQQVRTDLFL